MARLFRDRLEAIDKVMRKGFNPYEQSLEQEISRSVPYEEEPISVDEYKKDEEKAIIRDAIQADTPSVSTQPAVSLSTPLHEGDVGDDKENALANKEEAGGEKADADVEVEVGGATRGRWKGHKYEGTKGALEAQWDNELDTYQQMIEDNSVVDGLYEIRKNYWTSGGGDENIMVEMGIREKGVTPRDLSHGVQASAASEIISGIDDEDKKKKVVEYINEKHFEEHKDVKGRPVYGIRYDPKTKTVERVFEKPTERSQEGVEEKHKPNIKYKLVDKKPTLRPIAKASIKKYADLYDAGGKTLREQCDKIEDELKKQHPSIKDIPIFKRKDGEVELTEMGSPIINISKYEKIENGNKRGEVSVISLLKQSIDEVER